MSSRQGIPSTPLNERTDTRNGHTGETTGEMRQNHPTDLARGLNRANRTMYTRTCRPRIRNRPTPGPTPIQWQVRPKAQYERGRPQHRRYTSQAKRHASVSSFRQRASRAHGHPVASGSPPPQTPTANRLSSRQQNPFPRKQDLSCVRPRCLFSTRESPQPPSSNDSPRKVNPAERHNPHLSNKVRNFVPRKGRQGPCPLT